MVKFVGRVEEGMKISKGWQRIGGRVRVGRTRDKEGEGGGTSVFFLEETIKFER